jgi:hypothetical protein
MDTGGGGPSGVAVPTCRGKRSGCGGLHVHAYRARAAAAARGDNTSSIMRAGVVAVAHGQAQQQRVGGRAGAACIRVGGQCVWTSEPP